MVPSMTEPLTKRERRIKRRARKSERALMTYLESCELVQMDGRAGVFVPVQHQPGAGPGLHVVRTKV